jgi:alkanesulfonate monooxygenase SsuD/methylene tetrahydromethanopterin reductase-like flavin-dependent oxidoreductase (luciferase family)
MDFGIMLGDHPTTVSPAEHFDGILRQVEAAQRNGITYLLVGQHFLFPGGSRWLQPVPMLARLAGEVDMDTRLATQIIISPLYHPVMLAEELATLDIVTQGRLDVGLGLGYMPHEFETLGVPFDERVARFEEGIELMRALWTRDRVDFEGTHYRLSDATVHIRPIQEPHPPLWLGAQSKVGIRRAARLGDAWPITPQVSAEDLPARVKIFADERAKHDKPFNRLPIRREIFVGRDRDDAMANAVEIAQPWYLQMAAMGTKEVNRDEIVAQMPEVVARSFIFGSASECAAQLRAIGDQVPINPVVTRGNWPGMTTDDMIAYIETLGRELVPSMRDYRSTETLAMLETGA